MTEQLIKRTAQKESALVDFKIQRVEHLFSFYKAPVNNLTPLKEITLEDVHKLIIGDKYRTIIDKLRGTTDKLKQNKIKVSQLDYVTFSGIFSTRSNSGLIQHSNLFCLDLDNLDNIPQTKTKILGSLPPSLMFTSPSGNGLKLVYRINIGIAEHIEYYKTFEQFFKKQLNITIDDKCKDVSRACFLCYDSEAYLNKEAEILDDFFIDTFNPPQSNEPSEKVTDYDKIADYLKTWINKKMRFENGNRNQYVMQLAGAFNRFGISQQFAEQDLINYAESGFSESEIKSIVKSIYNNTTYFNTANFDIDSPYEDFKDTVEIRKEKNGLFQIKTANQWIEQAKRSPIPLMLFGEFWHNGELCILFADTNLGKSILAVQIADSISRGKNIPGFKLEAEKQPVLYFDFELSAKQFEVRYSIKNESEKIFEQHYFFDTNFKRVEINHDAGIPENGQFEDYLNQSLEQSIIETNAKILIIDNLTYLKNETEKAKDALPLMKHLKTLKSKYGLSILALAHTPKRDLSKPITRNDLQGSKMLINFVDSCFAIGESHNDKHSRYLKQIKARNTEIIYDTENVAVCQIQKTFNFLSFEFLKFGVEREHLKVLSDKDRESIIESVKELSKKGFSQRQIATELGISLGAVNKYLKL